MMPFTFKYFGIVKLDIIWGSDVFFIDDIEGVLNMLSQSIIHL